MAGLEYCIICNSSSTPIQKVVKIGLESLIINRVGKKQNELYNNVMRMKESNESIYVHRNCRIGLIKQRESVICGPLISLIIICGSLSALNLIA